MDPICLHQVQILSFLAFVPLSSRGIGSCVIELTKLGFPKVLHTNGKLDVACPALQLEAPTRDDGVYVTRHAYVDVLFLPHQVTMVMKRNDNYWIGR
ncbi:hypothetical protein M422DRAFT_32763 [Sphaerobolus stellatus SS14]|uniref:Uncharacterized protein n=1 Tax=Sphaerobolus stellatus (strain SS14) TaxID=990650 RepID=A0A0C9VND7_SPHS4|nr:hypothetical protein M422DRAFT_32763 [Sphaerobolus stellatus SS14]